MSLSKGNVIPCKDLALREIQERNGVLLSLINGKDEEVRTQQANHLDLIRQVAGEDVLAKCLAKNDQSDRCQETLSLSWMHIFELGVFVSFR